MHVSNELQLRYLHDLGLRAQRATRASPEMSAFDYADIEGVPLMTVRFAIQFSDAYSQEELERLISCRTPAGLTLPVDYVRILMRISCHYLRDAAARLAAREAWPPAKLNDIAGRLVQPPPARRVKRPRKVVDAMRLALVRRLNRFLVGQ